RHRRGYRFIGKLSETRVTESPAASAHAPLSSGAAASVSSPAMIGVLGREAELAKMQGWLDRALRGERQTVFVTGEPGIGKTSVVEAFLKQAALVHGLRVVRGQCLEHYGAGEPYLPVLEGFSRLCRSSGGADLLNLLRQHAPAWLAQMPSSVPATERESLQSRTTGATRERVILAMADTIDALSSLSSLLFVLENLQ